MVIETVAAVILALIFGVAGGIIIMLSRKEMWYLETLNPRQQLEIGTESKVISHMSIGNHLFNGIETGKYKVLLFYGSLDMFSKPVMTGKIEELYTIVLAKSAIGRKMVSNIERWHFLDFLHKHVPALKVKAHMITGELVSPQEVLDKFWQGKDRDAAFMEMKHRGLISNKVLWIKPYPPEEKYKEIMNGTLMIPDLLLGHTKDFEQLTTAQRNTLLTMNSQQAHLIEEVIVLARNTVNSISDPIQVIGLIISDRLLKIKGLGLEQLAERGSSEALIEITKRIKEHHAELTRAFEQEPSQQEMRAVMARLEMLQQQLNQIQKVSGNSMPPQLPKAEQVSEQ